MGEVDCVKSELYKGTRLENERGRPEIITDNQGKSIFSKFWDTKGGQELRKYPIKRGGTSVPTLERELPPPSVFREWQHNLSFSKTATHNFSFPSVTTHNFSFLSMTTDNFNF